MLDIVDDGTYDWETQERPDGSTFEPLNHEHVQRSELRIEARRWMAGKLHPKVYDDKLDVEHSGAMSITVSSEDAGS